MKKTIVFSLLLTFLIIILSCTSQAPEKEGVLPPDRLSKIPESAVKIKPVDDLLPPILHSEKEGGKGNMDIWVTSKTDGIWQEPENVSAVNSQEVDGWPFVSEDGKELWITRMYDGYHGIFRSIKDAEGNWSKPGLIISQFAGEASLDNEGNIYFTHHFYKDAIMLEADIYVAYKK